MLTTFNIRERLNAELPVMPTSCTAALMLSYMAITPTATWAFFRPASHRGALHIHGADAAIVIRNVQLVRPVLLALNAVTFLEISQLHGQRKKKKKKNFKM
jgi:hypothetical protein